MMKFIIGLVIFCLVLFIYLHIQFNLKTSDDLDMYELDQASKDKLDEVCDIRQPVLFDFDNEKIINTTNKTFINNNYHAFEIKIRNVKDTDINTELYMPLPLHAAVKLFDEDKKSCYLSENNKDFLIETGVIKNMQYNDAFLRPRMVSNCNYDILLGSNGTCTPFKYEINYRNFFLLTQGYAQIKMAPPKSIKYLYPIYDYENFEFRSPINPWDIQPNFTADFDKIKCLEFTLLPGKTLYIPAYWWYSIKFGDDTSISCFFYRTYMNNIAIAPYIGLHALQIQNIKRDIINKVDISTLNNIEFNNNIIYDNDNENENDNENHNENDNENDNANELFGITGDITNISTWNEDVRFNVNNDKLNKDNNDNHDNHDNPNTYINITDKNSNNKAADVNIKVTNTNNKVANNNKKVANNIKKVANSNQAGTHSSSSAWIELLGRDLAEN